MERRALLLCDAFLGWPPSWLLPAQMCVMRCEPATGSPSHIIEGDCHWQIAIGSSLMQKHLSATISLYFYSALWVVVALLN